VRVEVTSQTILIWIGLIGLSAAVLALFGWLAHSQHAVAEDRLSKSDRDELESDARNVLDKAQQAAVAAEYAEAGLALAETEREQAWQAHTEANEALEKANAELEPVPIETMPSQEQRQVSKAARDAFRRGELTEEQLRAVWQKVDGWDQALQEKAAELSRLRVEVAEAWRRYQLASSGERMARQRAEIAQVAARALKEEAADAAREAELAKKKRR
jgi:hypothetical protein